MCKRNFPQKKKGGKKAWKCKRKSPDKNKASTGCVRETPRLNMKLARDV